MKHTFGKTRRASRLHIRASEDQKAFIKLAANLQDRSVSDFVLEAATKAARGILDEESRLTVPVAQWKAFNEALDAEPRDIPKLQQLAREKSGFRPL